MSREDEVIGGIVGEGDIVNTLSTEDDGERSLVLICEGSAHTLEYMLANGVYPEYAVFDTEKVSVLLPYLTKKHDVVLLVKGLTDFLMSGIYAVINEIKEHADIIGSFTILTNVPLGMIGFDQILYSGDLFYGAYRTIPAMRGTGNELLPVKEKQQKRGKGQVKPAFLEGLRKYKKVAKIKIRGDLYQLKREPEVEEDYITYYNATIDVDFEKGSLKPEGE